MNLWFRSLIVLFTVFFRRSLDPLDESVLKFRVWPTDLDVNFHMNNGRYLTIMDLGRVDLMLRTGLGKMALNGSGRRWSARRRFVSGSRSTRFSVID